MNRAHFQAHAQVVEALSGHAPRKSPHLVAQYNDGSGGSQINPPRRTSRSNFKDRSNRRKTTGFEEIRQEYYQIHQNRATAEPSEEGTAVHHQPPTTTDGPQEYFPKPSAFVKAPRRTLPPRRPIQTAMDDTELYDGGGFRTRGSKAADLFQRRRERTDQFVIEQEETATPPHLSNPTTISLTPQTRNVQPAASSWEPAARPPVTRPNAPPPHRKPQMGSQSRRAKPQPPQQPMGQEPVHHVQQQQQQQQQQYQQQQHPAPSQSYHSNQAYQSQKRSGHTTVDSRRTRKPLAPANSPWNDRNMEPGKRFHPNVIPYQDSYNTSPKGWGGTSPELGYDNNVKYQYTNTTEKFKFNPAPRINKFGSGLSGSAYTKDYNSRPKSWCDVENYPSQAPPPSRRAYPAPQRQVCESSVNQFTGPSSWGYNDSDEL